MHAMKRNKIQSSLQWNDDEEVKFLLDIAGTMPVADLPAAFTKQGYNRSYNAIKNKALRHQISIKYIPE